MIKYNDRIGIKLEHSYVNEIDKLTLKLNKNRSKIVRQFIIDGLQTEKKLNNIFETEDNLQRQ